MPKFIACSNCFKDFGLQRLAEKIGKKRVEQCSQCQTAGGMGLTKGALNELTTQFFVIGSWHRTEYGGANLIQYNELRSGHSDVDFPNWLKADVAILEGLLKVGFFMYGPPTWRVGMIQPLEELENPQSRQKVLSEIVRSYPEVELTPNDRIFRIRTNIQDSKNPLSYDSAPVGKSKARLNEDGKSILYGSQDLEICIHECRVAISDEIYVGSLRPIAPLRCLDLTAEGPSGPTEFESLDLAVRFLFAAEQHSYGILTALAEQCRTNEFDGIIFPSYFSQIKPARIPNIAIFGRPISERKMEVDGINRLRLQTATYEYSFGPVVR